MTAVESSSFKQSNGVPLKPLGSRLIQKQSFTVHEGATIHDPLVFLEVNQNAIQIFLTLITS